METVKASYNCSQPTLYIVLLILAQNAKNHRVKLNSYKNKFTDPFFAEFIALVEEAKALPNEQQRAKEHEDLRVDLLAFNKTCHQNFQMSKDYIEEAFEQSKWILNFNAAGWQYYDSTSWKDCEEMNSMLVSYLTNNATKLETDGFMNASFVTKVTEDALTFSNGLQAFYLAEEKAREGTIAKLNKSNAAFNAGIAICKTGTIVANIENNPAMAEQFSFEALCALVNPPTASTLIIEAENSETEMPLPGAVITITGSDKTGTTNAEGRSELTQLPTETIHGTITADGFSEQPFTATLTGGTTRLKISMTPLFSGAMNVGSEGSQSSPQSTVGSGQMAGMGQ